MVITTVPITQPVKEDRAHMNAEQEFLEQITKDKGFKKGQVPINSVIGQKNNSANYAENEKTKNTITTNGEADAICSGPNIHVSTHPVISHKISILRSSSTIPSAFRSTLREITFHLGYEATMGLKTKPVALSIPVGHDHIEHTGKALADKVALVPIMRSGLGMVDSMLELLPNAGVHHIGMYRKDEVVVQYYNRLPRKCEYDVAFVLDPVIATASSAMSIIGILKKWGVEKIHLVSVIASKKGIKKVMEIHPDVEITVGTVDHDLTGKGIILPGCGDAGDRLFGTPLIDDDEALLHPSKRRKMSDL